MSDRIEIETRVAHAGWTEHRFRGARVYAELAGRTGFWSLLAKAVDGPPIDEEDARVLDDLNACATLADPRVPPLKLTRLVSAFGGCMPAVCAGYAPTEGAKVGTWTTGQAAGLLVELSRALRDPAAPNLRELLRQRIERRQPIYGFGVPFRPRDERVVAIDRCLQRRERATRPYWQLLLRIDGIMRDLKRAPANLSGAVGAVLLDLGFQPRQISAFSMSLALASFLANAFEGAAQAPRVLQELPAEAIRYEGTGPRPSARALAKDG